MFFGKEHAKKISEGQEVIFYKKPGLGTDMILVFEEADEVI